MNWKACKVCGEPVLKSGLYCINGHVYTDDNCPICQGITIKFDYNHAHVCGNGHVWLYKDNIIKIINKEDEEKKRRLDEEWLKTHPFKNQSLLLQ